MHWIFLSPHFDDAVFSCGGLIYEQVQQGDQVEIWTICAGDLPEGQLSPFAEELHARWTTGRETISSRAAEDQLA
ncbi:MAG: PIG-L family deacetylase, partial [Anaerolineaceae bacterium]|nr:PIG-L family deacetylase [Anaerolineaceae bacterium]